MARHEESRALSLKLGKNVSYMPEYTIWNLMLQRTRNPNAANYHLYGGRGITVCDRWLKFAGFYEDMGSRPSEQHTLDRIDNSKGYFPENCRWADTETQNNNRRNNVPITAFGKTQTLAQWVKERPELTRDIIKHRIFQMGMDPEEALTRPRMSWAQRPVEQYTKAGAFVARFDSLASAAKHIHANGGPKTEKKTVQNVKGSIFNCLSGKSKSSHGFVFKYVE